jgi:hypothetical protein
MAREGSGGLQVTITDEELASCSEGALLALIEARIRTMTKGDVKFIYSLHAATGLDVKTLSKCLCNQSHMGDEAWIALSRHYPWIVGWRARWNRVKEKEAMSRG